MENTKETTIEKWITDGGTYYWVMDYKGRPQDGFKKKRQAIDYIKRSGWTRTNKKVKTRS